MEFGSILNAHFAEDATATATVPVRICDVGGWTDTWFGAPGVVCSLAAGPGIEVTVSSTDRPEGAPPVHMVAPSIGFDEFFGPSPDEGWDAPTPLVSPLIQHAVGEVMTEAGLEPSQMLMVEIRSSIPPGASLGTSASVVVGIVAALRALVVRPETGGDVPAPAEVAAELAEIAHRVETGRARREAGVQDHWSAALGGAVHLAIDDYPNVRPLPLSIGNSVRAELNRSLVTVAFGSHDSSEVHGEVIQAFLTCDGVEHDRVRRSSRSLAALAVEAARALEEGDVAAWASVLVRSTEVQRQMHPGLVGSDHEAAIAAARDLGATGWKVNGAGGNGGSLTVVAPPDGVDEIRTALGAMNPNWRVLDLEVAVPGVVAS